MTTPRKLNLIDAAGFDTGKELDLTGMMNANVQVPIMAVISERCPCCETWHDIARFPLPNWHEPLDDRPAR